MTEPCPVRWNIGVTMDSLPFNDLDSSVARLPMCDQRRSRVLVETC